MMRKELLTPEVIKTAKSMKRKIVEITPHYMCGGDSQMCMFSIIYLNGMIPVDDELYYFGAANDLKDYNKAIENMPEYERFIPKMNYMRKVCQESENNKILFEFNDVLSPGIFDAFSNMMNMKAKDGSKMLNIPGMQYFMATSPTIHPINKSDVISITGYEYNEISYLAKFTITKKKYSINEYICYLYL